MSQPRMHNHKERMSRPFFLLPARLPHFTLPLLTQWFFQTRNLSRSCCCSKTFGSSHRPQVKPKCHCKTQQALHGLSSSRQYTLHSSRNESPPGVCHACYSHCLKSCPLSSPLHSVDNSSFRESQRKDYHLQEAFLTFSQTCVNYSFSLNPLCLITRVVIIVL